MAAICIPVARWLADPAAPALHLLYAVPLGAAALLTARIPFRPSLQYWRFATIGDLFAVAASAALFTGATARTSAASTNPSSRRAQQE